MNDKTKQTKLTIPLESCLGFKFVSKNIVKHKEIETSWCYAQKMTFHNYKLKILKQQQRSVASKYRVALCKHSRANAVSALVKEEEP